MPKTTEPPAPIRLTCNTILENRFFNAGEPLPVASVADLPETLQPLVATGELEPDQEPGGPCGAFELGALYRVTDDNRLGRRLQREVVQMEAEASTRSGSKRRPTPSCPRK